MGWLWAGLAVAVVAAIVVTLALTGRLPGVNRSPEPTPTESPSSASPKPPAPHDPEDRQITPAGFADGMKELWRLKSASPGRTAFFARGNTLVFMQYEGPTYAFGVYDYSMEGEPRLRASGTRHEGVVIKNDNLFLRPGWVDNKLVIPDPQNKQDFTIDLATGDSKPTPWEGDMAYNPVGRKDQWLSACHKRGNTCYLYDKNLKQVGEVPLGKFPYYYDFTVTDTGTFVAYAPYKATQPVFLNANTGAVTKAQGIPKANGTRFAIYPLADGWYYDLLARDANNAEVSVLRGYLSPEGKWLRQSAHPPGVTNNRALFGNKMTMEMTIADFESWLGKEPEIKFTDKSCWEFEVGTYRTTLPDTKNSELNGGACRMIDQRAPNLDGPLIELRGRVSEKQVRYQNRYFVRGFLNLANSEFHEVPGIDTAFQAPMRTDAGLVLTIDENYELVAYGPKG